MRARLAVDVICPSCGEIMDASPGTLSRIHGDSVFCRNRDCDQYHAAYRAPSIELEPVNERERPDHAGAE